MNNEYLIACDEILPFKGRCPQGRGVV